MATATSMDEPACHRNKHPIASAFLDNNLFSVGKKNLNVVEIGAGTGVHCLYLSDAFMDAGYEITSWHPTDPDQSSRLACDRILKECDCAIARESLDLMIAEEGVGDDFAALVGGKNNTDLIYLCNVLHISPWSCTLGVLTTAAKLLKSTGALCVYGPFLEDDNVVESNLLFSEHLRCRDEQWGVRNLREVIASAEERGLTLAHRVEMPKNNLLVVFKKK